MKKIGLVISLLCLASMTSLSAGDDHQFIPIEVLDNNLATERINRAPVNIPILAYYDELFTSVGIKFLQNIGDIDITITNLCTYDYIEYEVDSCIGSISLPVSGEGGNYRIVFILSNGSGYVGEFEI